MRNLLDVIDQMIACIPSEERDFIHQLQQNRSSMEYTAPELIGLRWKNTAITLHEHLGNPPFSDEWKQKIYNIWMNDEN